MSIVTTVVAPLPPGPVPRCGPALEARALTFVRDRRPLLRELQLSVAPGEFVAVLGDNGAGKTTLLHCLAGLLRPAAGEILWCGRRAGTPAARWLVGLLSHETGLYPALTAWENLLFAARMSGVRRPAGRAAQLLSAAGLVKQAGQQAGRLSRGLRQRLALARAVIHDPPIVLLDEPFTSLDQGGRAWLEEFLRALTANRRAIVTTSHDAAQSRRLADRVLRLESGRLHTADASPTVQSIDPNPFTGRA